MNAKFKQVLGQKSFKERRENNLMPLQRTRGITVVRFLCRRTKNALIQRIRSLVHGGKHVVQEWIAV